MRRQAAVSAVKNSQVGGEREHRAGEAFSAHGEQAGFFREVALTWVLGQGSRATYLE